MSQYREYGVSDGGAECIKLILVRHQPMTQRPCQFELRTLAGPRPVANVGFMQTGQSAVNFSPEASTPQRSTDGIAQRSRATTQPYRIGSVVLSAMDRDGVFRLADKGERLGFIETVGRDVKVAVRPRRQCLKGVKGERVPRNRLRDLQRFGFYSATVRCKDHDET